MYVGHYFFMVNVLLRHHVCFDILCICASVSCLWKKYCNNPRPGGGAPTSLWVEMCRRGGSLGEKKKQIGKELVLMFVLVTLSSVHLAYIVSHPRGSA
jgi:hypothetical protein